MIYEGKIITACEILSKSKTNILIFNIFENKYFYFVANFLMVIIRDYQKILTVRLNSHYIIILKIKLEFPYIYNLFNCYFSDL